MTAQALRKFFAVFAPIVLLSIVLALGLMSLPGMAQQAAAVEGNGEAGLVEQDSPSDPSDGSGAEGANANASGSELTEGESPQIDDQLGQEGAAPQDGLCEMKPASVAGSGDEPEDDNVEGDGGIAEIKATGLGDPVAVDGVTYSYIESNIGGNPVVTITRIEAPSIANVVIPSTLNIPSGDGSAKKSAAVVELKGDGSTMGIEGNLSNLTIPNSVSSIGVLSGTVSTIVFAEGSALNIPDGAFSHIDGLTSITLPSGTIGANAFEGRASLATVTWSSGTAIGDGAFQGCTALTSITLPNNLATIGENAFKGAGLTSITIPDSVTTIGAGAFAGSDGYASQLASVSLGSSVQKIGADAFKGALFTSIALPASLQSYYTNPTGATTDTGATAFSDCDNLATITWAETGGFTAVGGFWDCPNLATNTLQKLPTWITAIDNYAFANSGNASWTDLTIPGHIATIGDYAFEGREFQSVYIPASVTRIGCGAFLSGACKMTSLTIAADGKPLRIEEDAFNGALSYTLPSGGVTSVGEDAVVLPARVTYIGANAFTSSQYTNYRIMNKGIEIQKNGDTVADPWGQGLSGTVYYPSDTAAGSDIMKIKAYYENASFGSALTFEPFDVEPAIATHSIIGTVPAGASVTVSVAGVDYAPDLTIAGAKAKFTMSGVEEGALVHAIVSLEGYLNYVVYPAMDARGNPTSVVMPTSDWTINVTTGDMTPLSTTGILNVQATGDYSRDCRVAVFSSDGKLVSQGKVVRARFYTADSLPAGTYNVAVWQDNEYFTSVSSQADFGKMGLAQNTDYAWQTGVQIQAGKEKNITVNVPRMRTERIASMLKSGDVWLSNSITPPGVVFNARITYEMAGSNKANSITVSLPAGLNVQQVYSATHSYSAGEYTFNEANRTLTVKLASADKASGRLWLGLQSAPRDNPYTISAQVDTGSARVPLGSATINSPAIRLVVPDGALAQTSFDVTVFTAPDAIVSFAINGNALATTCKTNKIGRGTATLTIPQNEISVSPYYSVTANVQIAGRDYSTYEMVQYSSFATLVSPNVYEFYFTHSGGTVYLAREGKNLSGGYYFVLAHPEENPGAFRPTWEYTAVLESAIPLAQTATLTLVMLDESMLDKEMSLVSVENASNDVKRYTYHCSVRQKNATLGPDEIPYQFDITPAPSGNAEQIISALEPTLTRNFGDLVADTHAQNRKEAEQLYEEGKPHDIIPSIDENTTYADLDREWVEWVKTLDPEMQEKMTASMGVFGYAYKHKVWDPDGTWYNGLSPEDKAKVDEYESEFDKAFEFLAIVLGDKKPMPAYASYQEYLEDNYGYETGQNYSKEQLRAEGYTIIENTDTDKAKQAWGIYALTAPSWIAIKFDDGTGSDPLRSAQVYGPTVEDQVEIIVKNAQGQGLTKRLERVFGFDEGLGGVGHAASAADAAGMSLEHGYVASSTVHLTPAGAGKVAAAGKVCGFAGSVLSVVQTYRSLTAKRHSAEEYEERKGELDRVNQQIEYYASKRDKTEQMTKCEEALRLEKKYLEKLVNELWWTDWLAAGDSTVNACCGVIGSLAAYLIASGAGAEAGALFGATCGLCSLEWSAVSTAGSVIVAPMADVYTTVVTYLRKLRTLQCKNIDDFGRQHYYKNTLIDPSGWVYAGVEDNRLEGVVATIYQKVGDAWVPWAASEYDQENPQITGQGGLFAWDVVSGLWKVLFQKEGYHDTWSEEMTVPPEWTKVAINMLKATAPVGVAYSVADDYTYVDITFDQFVVTGAIPVVIVNGVEVPGAMWLNAATGKDADGNSALMALVLRIPLGALAASGAVLDVSVIGAKSYTGSMMESPYAFQIIVPASPLPDGGNTPSPAGGDGAAAPVSTGMRAVPAAASAGTPSTGDTLPAAPFALFAAMALAMMLIAVFMLRKSVSAGKHSDR